MDRASIPQLRPRRERDFHPIRKRRLCVNCGLTRRESPLTFETHPMNCSVMMGSRCRDTVRERGPSGVKRALMCRDDLLVQGTSQHYDVERWKRGGKVTCDKREWGMMVVMVTNRLVVPLGDVSRSKNGNTGDGSSARFYVTRGHVANRKLCVFIPWQKEWRYGSQPLFRCLACPSLTLALWWENVESSQL
jgi:hypothetical protein